MFKSKSNRSGILGTFLFHLFIFLICFFSSIGYTHVDIPSGLEIELIPYEQKNNLEDINKGTNLTTDNVRVDNNNSVEKIIIEEKETVNIPSDADSLSVSDFSNENSLIISSELADVFLKLNENNTTLTSEETLAINNNIELKMSDNIDIDNHLEDGYQLSDNRFAVRKVKPNYSCQESGKVVVRVWVNRSGQTIKAEPGIRGTTESALCLLNEAKTAALQTTWTPYIDAPDIQIGQITYNFHKY